MKKTRWDVLSVKDKASLIKLFVNNGIVSLKDMIDMYNTHTFSDGGDKDELELSGGVLPGATITSKKVEKRNTPGKNTFIPSNFIVPIEQPIERKAQLVNNYLVNQYNTIQEDIEDYLNNTTFLGDPIRTPNESLQYLKDLQDEQQYLEDLSAIKNINRYSRGGNLYHKYDGDSEPTGQMMLIGEDGNPIDVLPGAVTTYNTLSDYNRRQIKRLARNDYANVGEKTRDFDKDWQTRVYNRAWNRADREYRNQENRKALRKAAIQELQTGVPTGAFNEYTKEGIEDMAPFAMGLVNTAALPALSSLVPLGAAGRGAAKGLEWIGEKAMPSALLKSPVWRGATARAFQAAAPYADAAALSYWSALAGNTAYNAISNKDWGTASASGAMTLLPLVPAAFNIVKDTRNVLNAQRVLPQKDIGSQIAYRIINDAGFDDLINSGLIRPNPEGPYSHTGVQGGTWFSLDAPVTSNRPTILPNGNKVSYRGNYIIEVGDKSPQFPKGTTPGTEGLNYRLGAMEINPRDSFIRIRNRKTGKYISPKEYIAHSPYVSETLEAQRAVSEASPVVAQASAAKQAPYVIQDLGGGYMLKSLMRGNPLEKQIGKNGTINVNNIKAVIGKGGKVEQAVVDKVLASEEFVGKKSIDYNKFRKAVQDELITYDRTPDTRWADYGMSRIRQGHGGHPNAVRAIENAKSYEDRFNTIDIYGSAEERQSVRDLTYLLREGKISETEYDRKFDSIYNQFSDRYVGNSTPETFTFSSSRIPKGADNHYDENTLGHSRTYTTADEPDVLHVMESQSDWAQSGLGKQPAKYRIMSSPDEEGIPRVNITIDSRTGKFKLVNPGEGIRTSDFWKDYHQDYVSQFRAEYPQAQSEYLSDNYTVRQIQENLRYAAEKGQTKMRYPTRETAAKIEGYPINEEGLLDYDRGTLDYDRAKKELYEHPVYSAEHESILRKYTAFPKQFKKLYKNADVRIVTDSKGNTWYEVDVPENYLKQEWAYADGGLLNTLYNPTQFNINSTNNILYKRGGKINKGSYSTVLNKKREAEFQDWYSKIAKILNLDSNPDNQEHGYDYRGYWLENRKNNIDYSSPDFHFPDTWKQPWHETFSNESQYANKKWGINPETVGHWEGETFVPGVWNDIMGGRSPQSEFQRNLEWIEKLRGGSPRPVSYTPSDSIIEYIKSTEGFSPVWYKDGNGIDTIGYGFTGPEAKKLFPNGITREQADKYFSENLAKRAKILQRDTPNWDVLNQNQRDSLLSYHYNIGEGSYRDKSPKMQKALREKDWKTVTENIDFGYNDSANRGLRKRRDYERALFNTPVETKTSVQYKCGGKLKRKNRIYVE